MYLSGSPYYGRTCAECLTYMYDDRGEIKTDKRTGLPASRPTFKGLTVLPPCHQCPKIPDDAPERSYYRAIETTHETHRAILHYMECRAVGRFPDDPIVRRHAVIIRAAMDAHERVEGYKATLHAASIAATSHVASAFAAGGLETD